MHVTKAIIPVAGWGTRRLPITKAIEKCMLPIGNRPVVDYSVEQCIGAGITDIFFVVAPDFAQLRAYYSTNVELEAYLAKRGKTDLLASIQDIPHTANFHYIVQDPSGPYGTAVPVWLARDALEKDEHFMMLFGDSFVFNPDGTNDISRLINTLDQEQTAGAILGLEMPDEQLSRYGVLKTRTGTGNLPYLDGIVEKPAPGSAPSNLANVTYLLLRSDIMQHIEQVIQTPNEHTEHFLTDAVTSFARDHNIAVIPSQGQFLDGGELEGWVHANNVILAAQQH